MFCIWKGPAQVSKSRSRKHPVTKMNTKQEGLAEDVLDIKKEKDSLNYRLKECGRGYNYNGKDY